MPELSLHRCQSGHRSPGGLKGCRSASFGRPEFQVGYQHGVICAHGERVLVVCAEGPKGELGGGPHRIEPPPTRRAATVGGVGDRQVAAGRRHQAVRLQVLAEQITTPGAPDGGREAPRAYGRRGAHPCGR